LHFSHVVIDAAVAGCDISIFALHNLIKSKEFYLGWRLFSSSSIIIVFYLLPNLWVNPEGLHLVANFLNQTLGRVGHGIEILAIFKLLR
jgi:hypothetical protein